MHTYRVTEKGKSIEKAQKAVILIHGRGAPPEDILGLADFFDDCKTWFAAPEAENHTWYPYSFLTHRYQNQPWLDSAITNIETLIKKTEEHIPAESIYIMGFSQGACLTAEVAARNARRYGGIAIFTGGLIGDSINESFYKGDFAQTPVYISNGDNDPHIPLYRTEETHKIMKQLGANALMEIFPARPHTITMSEIKRVKEWLFNLD
jgi:phospholipase/carboxylesterase